jgi:hypothetical protein
LSFVKVVTEGDTAKTQNTMTKEIGKIAYTKSKNCIFLDTRVDLLVAMAAALVIPRINFFASFRMRIQMRH